MVSLYNEIHFWSTHEDIFISPSDFTSTKFLTRKDASNTECKTTYFTKRGFKVILPNKRPEKLRDKLQEFEEALQLHTIVTYNQSDNLIQFLLSKGLIINVKLSQNGDLSEINFDKTLVPKVQSDYIVDGIINQNQVVASCKDNKIIGYSDISKEWTIESAFRRNINVYGEWLVCWGRAENDHPQPWSPLAKDHQRANIHLYWIGSRGPDLLSHKKTEGEPIKVIVSKKAHRSLILVEQKVSQKGAVSVEVSVLELVGSTLKRNMVTLMPLQTQVCCSSLSHNESFLLIGCIDGSLALLDRNRGSTRTIKNSFIPTYLTFHESETIAVVMNERGYLQYYDIALNCLTVQMNNDEGPIGILDISKYFEDQRVVESVYWGTGDIFISMDSGPLVLVRHVKESLRFVSLIQMYLHAHKIDKAISLLLSWEFNEAAFNALQRIVAQILRTPLNETTAKLLQEALGSYHSPPVPLSAEVRHTYGLQVKSLTRRFFHQLVRTKMFETAFLLAVDLGHHDLFMDLHHIAVDLGETEMAAAARAQASSILSQCSSEASNCSRTSCSQCLDSSSEEESLREDTQENSDYLSTNFNNPVPKTYKPAYVPPIPNIDLPKIKLPSKSTIPTPPLPMASFNSIGIPITTANHHPLPFHPNITPVPPPRVPFLPPRFNINTLNTLNTPVFNTLNTQSENRFIPIPIGSVSASVLNPNLGVTTGSGLGLGSTPAHTSRILTPPLPQTTIPLIPNILHPLNPANLNPQTAVPQVVSASTTNTNGNNANTSSSGITQNQLKKPQPKVKFSDTVTAFIVPEVKRPVRHPPPAHVMDPQKELADSLPLCHPNEEYLKDFTPIRRDSNDSPPPQPQPKITVVHFGVV
ncbi:WD repeat-containing and planar cell polarity effector protein fritz homolog [Atheta coriaria]|uniref:WD repeat-containing and planar cell polarity effector protein fritz homolog n=1 Tax=Dalotia coriaria TaxID=877792 RepID=UPI0031F4444D